MTNLIDLTELESNTNSLYEKGTMDFAHMNSDSLKSEVDLLITKFDQLLENTESNIFPPISNSPTAAPQLPLRTFCPITHFFFLKPIKVPAKTKARLLMLKGKTLDIRPEYQKLAEQTLSKSVM
jgi:hypothetical protein